MVLKFLTLKNDLKTAFYPVIAIDGDDAYLRGKAVETVRDSINLTLPDLNLNSFTEQATMDEILYACESLPFCSEKKLVVADFSNVDKVNFNATDREKLAKYCKKPNDACCLVFVFQKSGDLIKNGDFARIDCSRLDKISVIKWIKAKTRSLNKNIDDGAAELVAEYCLFDMTRISTETEKLCAYSDNITQSDVAALVHKDSEYQVFDLANHIAAKRADKALETLDLMLGGGEEATGLLALLYNTYRRMFFVSVTGGANEEIAKTLGVKEYAITKTRELVKKYSPLRLKNALEYFENAEDKIKQTWGKDGELLKNVVLKLLYL